MLLLVGQRSVWGQWMTLGRASAPNEVPISAAGRRCQAAPATVARQDDSRAADAIEALLDGEDRPRYNAAEIGTYEDASGEALQRAAEPPLRLPLLARSGSGT